jgi:transitional endoplasmic reticulum ATPase
MKNSPIKIKVCEETEGFAIAPETLNQISNGSGSYIQPFEIEFGKYKWHGKVSEASDEQARGTYLLIGENLANELGIKDGLTVNIGLSRLEPINRIQMEASKKANKKGGSPLSYVAGIQPEVGKLINYEGMNYVIKSIDPREGYIDEDTTVEVLGKDGKVEVQLSSPIKRKLSASKGKGFSQIIGMEDVIEEIKLKVIMPIQNPSLAAKYMKSPLKGAILNGPFGIGKTALVKATAEELGIPFYHIPNSIATSTIGPSYIQRIYQTAANNKDGAIIFLDEIDAVAPRGQQGDATTTALQEAMDGYNRNPKLFTIAATNNLHNVAEGLLRPGRFDIIIDIKLPSEDAREKLHAHFLSDLQTESGLDFADLAGRTASFTGADIEAVCKNAGTKALSDHCKTGKNQYISQAGLVSEIQSFNPTGARILGVQRPKFTFDDMFGAEVMKKQLKRKLDLLSGKVDSPYAVANSTLMLLHGPPGTGKTMVAQCMASYLKCNFKYKPATSFKNKYVGETESNIRKLFNTGRTYEPMVIFLDEIDSIGKTRSSHDPYTASALNELLTELDGIANNKGVFVVAATNRVEDLDPALRSRVSCDFEMSLPDTHQRTEVLRGLLRELPADQIDYAYLAQITPQWSQRNLAGLKSAVVDKLALEEVSTITTGVLEDIIVQRPAESSNQSSLIGRTS